MKYSKICEKCGSSFLGGPAAKICENCKNLSGQKIGMWTVLEMAPNRGRYDYFLCRCECGTEKEVSGNSLRAGTSQNCGCVRKKRMLKQHEADEDLTGQKFGELTVLKCSGRSTYGRRLWLCECSCGKRVKQTTTDLRGGRAKSCGHVATEKVAKIADCGTNPAAIASLKMNSRNTSGFKGVWFDKRSGRWAAEIYFQGRKYFLGRYNDIADAVRDRKLAEEKLHGEFLKWYAEAHREKWEKIAKRKPGE